MVRWTDLPDYERDHMVHLAKDCVTLEPAPWVTGPPLAERRVAIITTAGLQRRGDRPFTKGASDFRFIPGDQDTADLVMSHISVNFDRQRFPRRLERRLPHRPSPRHGRRRSDRVGGRLSLLVSSGPPNRPTWRRRPAISSASSRTMGSDAVLLVPI